MTEKLFTGTLNHNKKKKKKKKKISGERLQDHWSSVFFLFFFQLHASSVPLSLESDKSIPYSLLRRNFTQTHAFL